MGLNVEPLFGMVAGAFGILLAIGIALLIVGALAPITRCPRCGGDLVEWSVAGVSNGFDVVMHYRGCARQRDKETVADDPFFYHYAELKKVDRTSRFDPYRR